MKKQFILIAILLAIVAYTCSWKTFNLPPASVHQWRQSDCAAYISTYYHQNNSLLQPATYTLVGYKGRTASEFPILYYIDAKIEHLIGRHYYIARGVTFLCYLAGLLALFACCRRWLKDSLLSFLPVLLLATSPYYYFYAINFLPNIPAISFSFIGLYFFLLYEDDYRSRYLLFGTLFFILSTALKPTDGGIIWLASMAVKLYNDLIKERIKKEYKKTLLPYIYASLLIGLCIIGWSKYVIWYNDTNGNHQNLTGILPIWIMDKNSIIETFQRIKNSWIHSFQHIIIINVLLLCLVIYIVKWKYLHPFLRLITLFTILGTIVYSVLWFVAFFHHDYYQLIFIFSAVFLFITILEFLERKYSSSKKIKWLIYSMSLVLTIISINHNKNIQLERYTNTSHTGVNAILFEMESYLDSIGVTYNDTILSVPDKSPNISLNAISRFGYTEWYYHKAGYSKSDEIICIDSIRADYLIISDDKYLSDSMYLPLLRNKIGEYKGVSVFDIRNRKP